MAINFTPTITDENGVDHNVYLTTRIKNIEGLTAELNNRYTKTETDTRISEEIDKMNIPTHLSELSQNASYRTVTDTEKATWNNKETKSGAQTKADEAESNANDYTDLKVGPVETSLNTFRNLKGAKNGLAELDGSGNVPTSQLPSYVDDVLIYDTLAAFPAPGETGKIYVTRDTNITYRWNGTDDYVEISKSLALGETSSTAYAGSKGKANRNDINNIINTYATQSWVTGRNYVNTTLMNSTLLNYAKTSDIPSLAGYATESWVENKNYAKVTDIPTVPTDLSAFNNDMQFLTFQDVQGNYVPISRTINSKPLSSNINLTAADVGAMPAGSGSGFLPASAKVNNHSFNSANDYHVTLTAGDVGALASNALTGYATQSWVKAQGYLTEATGFHDSRILDTDILNWNIAYGWGNHANAGYVKTDTNNYVTGISGSGNGVLTLTRQGLPDLIQSLSHSHGSFTQSNDIPNNQVLDKITVTNGIVSSYSLRTMTPAHIGAATANHAHSNYVPTSRTINNKALSSNISLSAADVDAVASNRTIAGIGLTSNIPKTTLQNALDVPTDLDDLVVAGADQVLLRTAVGWTGVSQAPDSTRWGGYRIRVGSYSSGTSNYITFGI